MNNSEKLQESTKSRLTVYLHKDISKAVRLLAVHTETSGSAIIEAALLAYFKTLPDNEFRFPLDK